MPAQASPEDPTQHPSLEEAAYPFRHLLWSHTDSLLMLLWGTPSSSAALENMLLPSTTPGQWTGREGAHSRAAAPLITRRERPGLRARLRTLMNSKPRVEGNENHDYPLTNGHWEVLLPPRPSIKSSRSFQAALNPMSTTTYIQCGLPVSYSILLPDERV